MGGGVISCNPLIFSALYIVPVRFISSFVVKLLAKIQKDFDNVSIFPAFFEKRLKNLEVSDIIRNFSLREKILPLETPKKSNFPLVFCSLIRIFEINLEDTQRVWRCNLSFSDLLCCKPNNWSVF